MDQFSVRMRADLATKMSCIEADCPDYRMGWATIVDEATDLGARQAVYIRSKSGRRFVEMSSAEAACQMSQFAHLGAGLTVFVFPAGQVCFRRHLDREVEFVHNARLHVRPQDFNEDFNETAARAEALLERG